MYDEFQLDPTELFTINNIMNKNNRKIEYI